MKRILSFLLLTILAAFFSSCAAPEEKATSATASATATPSPTENVEQVISKLEQDWTDAIIKRDLVTIERIVSDDYSATLWDGSPDSKAHHIEAVKSGRYKLAAQKLDIGKVRVFGDVALATLTLIEISQTDGKDSSGTFLYTDIWNKRNGGWQIVASHGCKAPSQITKP